MPNWYRINVESLAAVGSPKLSGKAVSALSKALVELMEPYSGSVGVGSSTWSATVTLQADDVVQAAQSAQILVDKADTMFPGAELVRCEIVREDISDAELEETNFPPLLGAAEVAEILGVSRQRVWSIAKTHKEFPKPIAELRMGPMWMKPAIEAFASKWDRKPGRPTQKSVAQEEVNPPST